MRSAHAQNPVHAEFWVVAQFCCLHQSSVDLESMLQTWISPQATDQPLGTVGGGGGFGGGGFGDGGLGGGGCVQGGGGARLTMPYEVYRVFGGSTS